MFGNILLHVDGATYALFETLRIDSSAGLRDLKIVEEIINFVKNAYKKRVQPAAAVLDELLHVADVIQSSEMHPEANYVSSERLAQLLQDEATPGETKGGADMYVPFEITDGVYAAFSSDSSRIYIGSPEDSTQISNALQSAWTGEYTGAEGSKIPSYQYEYVPEELIYSVDAIIDQDQRLDTVAADIGITDPDIITDYITILRSHTREIIETKFNLRLVDLSIAEQLHFLNYLKNITVAEAAQVQTFTVTHGINGMRAFLSLERGDMTGEDIIMLGTHPRAAEVFAFYTTLLDRSVAATEIIHAAFDGDTDTEIAASVEAAILEKAHKAIKKASVDGDIDHVLSTIEKNSQDAIGYGEVYLELKKAGLIESPEDMKNVSTEKYSGFDLLYNEDKLGEVDALYRERFSATQAQERIDSFHEKLHDPNVTIHTFEFNGRIINSLLTEDRGDVVYVGTFNTTGDTSVQSLRLGTHALNQVVEKIAAEGKTLEATSLLGAAEGYVNAYNFIAVAELPNETTTEPRFLLQRNDGWEFPSKNMGKRELLDLYAEQAAGSREGGGFAATLPNEPNNQPIIVRLPRDETSVPKELAAGYAVTRFIRDAGNRYYVLESFSPDAPSSKSIS